MKNKNIYLFFIVLLIINCNNRHDLIKNPIIEIIEGNESENNNIFYYEHEVNYETLSLLIENIKIEFNHFPTKNIWEKKKITPIFDTDSKRNFISIITDGSKKEPNFNGKYRIVEFGVGSGVQSFFIIDLNNGIVYEGVTSSFGIKYTLDSNLIIKNDPEIILEYWKDLEGTIPNWIEIEYYIWQNNQLKKILSVN